MLLIEEQRFLHEDLERLEDAAAERLQEDPPHIRDRLARDHDIARFLELLQMRSKRLMTIYEDKDGQKDEEIRNISLGDSTEAFYKEVNAIKDFHRRYPDERVENLEKSYKRRGPEDKVASVTLIERMFTGEEGFGRFFDLTMLHEQYLNLPVHKQGRRLTYLQYVDVFDNFTPPHCNIQRGQKKSDSYFRYIKALRDYLEGFMRRTRPLENLGKVFATFDNEFDELWEKEEVPGWEKSAPNAAAGQSDTPGEGIWCSACKKGFSKETVYEAHLMGKKHKKAVQEAESNKSAAATNGSSSDLERFKERAVAEVEFRIKKLAAAMQTERGDTKVNVERKQGMTERERQQELEQLYSEDLETADAAKEEDNDEDGEEKIYNPLKLPLAWDGKPIPFWLFKLHGLGVEFNCEICGNYVYMGRRAFDKHFNEPRHLYGLKALKITNSSLFRDITSIEEAQALNEKIQKEKKKETSAMENVVEMEDTEGNVMPEKVYHDLAAQGLL